MQRTVDVEHTVQAAHQEALDSLQAQITAAQEVTVAKEASMLEKEGTIAHLESRLSELNDKAAGLESAIGQSQPSSWSLSVIGIPIAALAPPCC
jgi:predicted  nucleic acid-binding Zn-ribbon protein